MRNVLVDTDVLIDFSKNKDKLLVKYLEEKDLWQLWVNPVVIAEWLNNQELAEAGKLKKADEFISAFNCAELGKNEGKKAGKLIRNRQIDYLGDALIAANCLVRKMSLLTRNRRHFKKVRKLKLLD